MTPPAIIAITFVLLSLCACSIRYYRRNREWHQWLERDRALSQAFHDYLARGEIEEAREIRQAALANFRKHFNPQH